ncbi:DeoR/GlpR family DNA-binding transcription regulator [Lactobacillus mulieris]|uniref:Lactose phosphotransferase system repressor n=1 Tax=Lactobacillus mulieris TaxID=2508708 RepID=A0AAW5WYL0_9LACO|nr:DeoR/GlpR family DNA-binding transcription regulator [Lactobacillus mulieris]MCZ3622211.1 DeoR/GlpR family DNA-binding transcription regulator [Lactobacillus mulieris]MCZ3623999.1 DeoR/GlpR family DNA-binding transcription regulator [Lactobacillus mulieris]MCZ3636218.1 DeoR/GlpR family DNA-binding transcription regulator [Lactobacillus mulieris]MCZ3689762.1 DeoR/GlpR family DNA-binding transcription regulator [Lactobacillus mulieris]MCZ3695765.1 DeoR/GlpR family DNA-binding transcription re
MLKRERLEKILEIVKKEKVASVSELAEKVKVSEMTIRRDLDELSASNRLLRVHGGARIINDVVPIEIDYQQKREIHIPEKKDVAKSAAELIKDGETIYVGPGTTLELMVANLKQHKLRIITNSLPVFNAARANVNNFDLILIGGIYRRKSGAFVGAIANRDIQSMAYDRAFVGVNGIMGTSLMTANMDEGLTQAQALNRAKKRYIVTDMHKFDRSDFYEFYRLDNVDKLITNQELDKEKWTKYSRYTDISH